MLIVYNPSRPHRKVGLVVEATFDRETLNLRRLSHRKVGFKEVAPNITVLVRALALLRLDRSQVSLVLGAGWGIKRHGAYST